jgi:hypothetical protein
MDVDFARLISAPAQGEAQNPVLNASESLFCPVRQGFSTVRRDYVREGYEYNLRLSKTQAFGHFVVEKPFSWRVGLHPFAVDYKLWDGALAGSLYDFIHRTGRGFDVYFFVRDVVLGQKALGFAAIGAPD